VKFDISPPWSFNPTASPLHEYRALVL